MDKLKNPNIQVTPLKKILTEKGPVLHGLKASDDSFSGFGEAYFSFIEKDSIKGWKLHKVMKLNLVVPRGSIKFVIYNPELNLFDEVTIGENNYKRLTINPGQWVAFKGNFEVNMLLNIASIEHDPQEAENKELKEISYDWN